MESVLLAGTALIVASFCAGICGSLIYLLRRAEKQLEERVTHFREITKQASDANNSFYEKVMGLEKRLEVVEFRQQASPLKK